VPDEVVEPAHMQFSDEELIDLTTAALFAVTISSDSRF